MTRLAATGRRLSRWLQAHRPAGRRAVVAGMVLAVMAAGGTVGGVEASAGTSQGGNPTHLTAYFSRTIGIYVGNDVDILGVKVGQIDSLTPEGSRVKVTMSLDGDNPLPADATAVIIPPSLVSDRYLQLQPAYSHGPKLANNTVLGLSRTAVPLEYDEIFRNLNQLTVALGPKGANKHGALSRLLKVGAENLQGNGGEINSALAEFSDAVSTLSDNRGNLFGTVTQLQKFTTTLAQDDGGVKAVNGNLAKVGTQLADERADLGTALSNLSSALGTVTTFVANNRANLTSDIHGLTTISKVLVNEKTAIQQILDTAPEAVTNLSLAGDNKVTTQQSVLGTTIETLDTKTDTTVPFMDTSEAGLLCQTLTAFGLSSLCNVLSPSALQSILSELQSGGGLSGLTGTLGTLLGGGTGGTGSTGSGGTGGLGGLGGGLGSLSRQAPGATTPDPTSTSTPGQGLSGLLGGLG